MNDKKEIREFLEKTIDRILIEKKKEKLKKLKIQKKLTEQKRKEKLMVDKIKKSLHETLKTVDWANLDIPKSKKLIKNLKKWIETIE